MTEENNKQKTLDVLKEFKIVSPHQVAEAIGIHFYTAQRILIELSYEGKVRFQRSLTKKNYSKCLYFLDDELSKKNESIKIQ